MRRFLFLAFLLASCAPQHPATMTMTPDTTAVLAGRKLFRQHCAACHGPEAAGTKYAPSLRGEDVQAMDAEWIFKFITNGELRGGMPSWSRLPDERRWQIVAYLKSLEPSRAAK